MTESYARQICDWSDLLPCAYRDAADQILVDAAADGADLDDLALLAEEMFSRVTPPDKDDEDDARFGDRFFRLTRLFQGHGRADGDLTPECLAALHEVLDTLGKKAGPEDDRTAGQRRHDALEEAMRLLLASGCLPERAGQAAQVQLHMNLDELLGMPGGTGGPRLAGPSPGGGWPTPPADGRPARRSPDPASPAAARTPASPAAAAAVTRTAAPRPGPATRRHLPPAPAAARRPAGPIWTRCSGPTPASVTRPDPAPPAAPPPAPGSPAGSPAKPPKPTPATRRSRRWSAATSTATSWPAPSPTCSPGTSPTSPPAPTRCPCPAPAANATSTRPRPAPPIPGALPTTTRPRAACPSPAARQPATTGQTAAPGRSRPASPPAAASGTVPGTAPASPATPGGLARLQDTLLRYAVSLLSGPTGLAAYLRTQLTGGFFPSPSLPLDLGQPTEQVPPHLRRAVTKRDRHCSFPGCTAPPVRCHVHHVIPRSQGGPTRLDNLTLLCAFHHLIAVHRWGWTLHLHADGTTTATSPDGTKTLHSHSPPPGQDTLMGRPANPRPARHRRLSPRVPRPGRWRGWSSARRCRLRRTSHVNGHSRRISPADRRC